MALKIRLARGGRRHRPHYSIVVADSRMPRDGRFVEKVGSYDPLLPKDSENRVSLIKDRIEHWLKEGAKPTDRVATFLGKAGLIPMPAQKQSMKKAEPKEKAKERLREKEEKLQAQKEAEEKAKAEAESAAAAAQEQPAEEAPAEEPAAEAPAEAPAEAESAEEEKKAE